MQKINFLMKLFRLLLFFLLFTVSSFSQIIEMDTIKVVSPWTNKNIVSFDLNEIAFVNWSQGGTSSVSGLIKGTFTRNFDDNSIKWGNELLLRYGMNKQDGIEFRKTDDAIQFNSAFGYRTDTITNWYYSAKFSFSTQFTNGYSYPNTEKPISKPFSPAYTFLGVGAEYASEDKSFTVYISPLTLKNTLVMDQILANKGAFGVRGALYDPITKELIRRGEMQRTELGFLVSSNYKTEIFENIMLENRLILYSDYINRFGNVDIDWKLQLDLKVNKYVRANVGTNIVYDDDIKTKENVDGEEVTRGAKIQLKQILGIGVVYEF